MPSASHDSVVEVPPREDPPPPTGRWAVPIAVTTLLLGLAVLVESTTPTLPAVDWALAMGPPGSVNLDTLVALEDGFAVLSGVTPEGIPLWWQTGGSRWRSQPLQGAPHQLSVLGDHLIAYDGREGTVLHRTGEAWSVLAEVRFPDDVRSRRRSGRAAVVEFRGGVVISSLRGEVWWSPDLEGFRRVVAEPAWGQGTEQPFSSRCRPPSRSSPDVPTVLSTGDRLIAYTGSDPEEPFGIWPVCEPRAWRSPDAVTWTEAETSIGDGGYFYDVAWRDGRFVAVGGYGIGESVAWTSEDGLDWEPIPGLSIGDGLDLFTVDTGPAGWIVLGRSDRDGRRVGWTSIDGSCWESLPDGVGGGDAVVSAERILLVDRADYPRGWMGRPGGGDGRC